MKKEESWLWSQNYGQKDGQHLLLSYFREKIISSMDLFFILIWKHCSSLSENWSTVAAEFVADVVDGWDDQGVQGLQLGPRLGRGHLGLDRWPRVQRPVAEVGEAGLERLDGQDQFVIVKVEMGITSDLRICQRRLISTSIIIFWLIFTLYSSIFLQIKY